MKSLKHIISILSILFAIEGFGQETVVKGKVIDAETGEALPYATVAYKGTKITTTTNFEGFYTIATATPGDSIEVSYLGYQSKTRAVRKGLAQEINFQLYPEGTEMPEVVLKNVENPAWRIMRRVIKNKEKNDKRSLSAYQYNSYNKTEIHIDNISDKIRQRKAFRKIARVFDSLKVISGEDGRPVLPVFVSEALSSYYYRKDPEKSKEVVEATKITGVGVEDGSLVSQLIGSSFQEYNFYKNWLNILGKDFVSPIADGWKDFYEYELQDSMMIGKNWCYKISVKPKRVQDLAFTGNIWIADTIFALKQIEVTIGKGANINYIDKIKIHQQLYQTPAGPWLPEKTRVMIDIQEITENSPGMLAKFYTSNKNFVVNEPKPVEHFDQLIVVAEDAQMKDEQFWNTHRHDTLTPTELNVYKMIDSVKNVPVVKTYVEVANIAVNGYKKVGKVDIGPYLFFYSHNNIEGNRFRVGLRTNQDFSKKWILKGYGAYGFKDNRFKYSVQANYIIKRKPWTMVGFERTHDIEQVGFNAEYLQENNNNLFLAFINWGTLRGPYFSTKNDFRFQTNITKDFREKITFRMKHFDPLYPFAYYRDVARGDSTLQNCFDITEVTFEQRYARDELFVQNNNERISLGTKKWPIFTLKYTAGLKGVAKGDFSYHKLTFHIEDEVRWGVLGRTYYDFFSGYIFSQVPYPLLEVHIGNQTPFYTTIAYNLMNYFEFVSDHYVALKYRHYFEGLFFNRIPLIQKLKWRFLTTGNILYGGLSQKNASIIPPTDQAGRTVKTFSALGNVPYIELGYGIENIFKIVRVDAFHRLTYLNKPGVKRFGVKVSLQFTL